MAVVAVAPLCKHVDATDPLGRLTILLAISKVADKTSTECVTALEKQIDKDAGKPGDFKVLVAEMRTVRAKLAH